MTTYASMKIRKSHDFPCFLISEISSFVDSRDNFSDNLIVSMTGPLTEDLVMHESIGVTTNMAAEMPNLPILS